MDKLTALRVFRRIAERGSFAAAARDLKLSNPAVSKNVRELEAELGVRLIQRTTRRLHLTEAGALYLARARAVLDDLDEADASAAEQGGALRGQLRVSAPMSLGLTLIAPLIAAFLIAHPAIKVDLELDDRYVDMVGGGFDLALRGGVQLSDSSLIARRLASLTRVACAAPGYLARHGAPRRPEELGVHACLIYSLSNSPDVWTFTCRGETHSARVQGPLRVNSSVSVAEAAMAGLGIALLPYAIVREALADGRLAPVLDGWTCDPVGLYAVTPKHRQSAPKVRVLTEHLARGLV